MPEISVIVVNYGTAALAIEAARSVLSRSHGGRSVEVHVVDNASPGGDAAELRAALGSEPRVTLHLEDRNHGFGRGNNVALEALARRPDPPGKVFLLNPDARLDNEALDALAAFLDSHPEAGAAGARILSPEREPVAAAFRFPSLASEFSRSANFGPVSRALARWRVAHDPALPVTRVDWVSGAAVMFRFDALREAGFFDPAYFLYYEEVDLMRRMGLAGRQIWHVPDALVVHAEGAATGIKGRSPERRRRPAYWYRSWRTYFRKNHGRGYATACAGLMICAGALNHAVSRVRGKAPVLPLDFAGDVWGVVLRPLLGLPEQAHD